MTPARSPSTLDAAPVAARRTPFLGWRIVAGAVTMQALLSALFAQSYGVYAVFWTSEFGWSRTTLSLAYALQRTESALLGPVHGWLLQRFAPRRVVLAGVLTLGLGFVALSQARGLAPFLAVYFLMAIGASLAGLVSLTTVLVNWFDRYRARAISLMATGLSIGGLAVPLLTLAMVAYGWRPVAAASGVAIVVLGVPLSRLFHRDPESLGQRPDGAPPPLDAAADAARPRAPSMGVRDALRTSTFWRLSFAHASGIAVVSALLVHYVLFVGTTAGVPVTLAATLLTAITVAAMVGQLVGGALGDRTDKRRLAGAGMVGHGVAVLGLATVHELPAVAAFSVLHGLAWGVRGPLMSAMRADYFGRGSYAMIMGVSSLVVTIGSIAGPFLVGALADAQGSYGTALVVLAGVAFAGAATFFTLPPLPGAPRAPLPKRFR